jgi:hypothetical protein
MARIDDLLESRPPSLGTLRIKTAIPNLDGLSVDDMIQVFRALDCSAEVRDKRVLFCWVRSPGDSVVVQTGWAHGGCNGGGEWVLVVKEGDGWRVDGVRWWRS